MGVPGPPLGEGRLVVKKMPQTWESFRTRDEKTDISLGGLLMKEEARAT